MRRIALALVLALVACGSDDDTEAGGSDGECFPAVAEGESIAGGLRTSPAVVEDAQGIRIEGPDSDVPMVRDLDYLVAGRVNGSVGVWAMTADRGAILAIDTHSRQVSIWGADIAPGSPVAQGMSEVAAMPEVDQVRQCVSGAE
jgi:hypothetical protein